MFDQQYKPSFSSEEETEHNVPKNSYKNKEKDFYGTDFTPISKTSTSFSYQKDKRKLSTSKLNNEMSNKNNMPSSSIFLYHPKSKKYRNAFDETYYPELSSNTWNPAHQFNNNIQNLTQFRSVAHNMTTQTYFSQPDTTKQR